MSAPSRAFQFAIAQPWAIERLHLSRILDIARRAHTPDFAAVAQQQADARAVSKRDGSVAVIPIIGPIFRYAGLFAQISGASSVEQLSGEFQAAVNDPEVKAIILNVNSPGGEVTGISDLSQAIFGARGTKPIIAFVDGLGASAAYWLASAADRVVVASTAMAGSIGVMMAVTEKQDSEGETTYKFVSSISPNKAPDLASDEGKSTIQALVDDMASVFVADVARNRGRAVSTVLKDFGQGGLLVGTKCVSGGLADEVSTFAELLDSLTGNNSAAPAPVSRPAPARRTEARGATSTAKPWSEILTALGYSKTAPADCGGTRQGPANAAPGRLANASDPSGGQVKPWRDVMAEIVESGSVLPGPLLAKGE